MKRLTANRLALAALGTLAFSGAAFAQQPEGEFVVSSSRTGALSHASVTGASDHVISISRRVSFADLNLASYSGSQEVEARVRTTAKALCDKLDELYSTSRIDVQACVGEAVSKGMADVRVAIATAEKKARTAAVVSRN
jgi:UrcA family protein